MKTVFSTDGREAAGKENNWIVRLLFYNVQKLKPVPAYWTLSPESVPHWLSKKNDMKGN